jgi:hypothetical protein
MVDELGLQNIETMVQLQTKLWLGCPGLIALS